MSLDTTPAMPWKYPAAARLLRTFSWTQIGVPVAAILVTIPGSLFFLVFGGVIVVAPPIALGVVGLGISRSLRSGRRPAAAAVLGVIHATAYAALALHSRTWDPRTQGEANFFLLTQVVFWIAVVVNVVLIAIVARPSEPVPDRHQGDEGIPELRPRLWPWLVAGAVILALIVFGIAIPGSQ